jgi:hypothetical protein
MNDADISTGPVQPVVNGIPKAEDWLGRYFIIDFPWCIGIWHSTIGYGAAELIVLVYSTHNNGQSGAIENPQAGSPADSLFGGADSLFGDAEQWIVRALFMSHIWLGRYFIIDFPWCIGIWHSTIGYDADISTGPVQPVVNGIPKAEDLETPSSAPDFSQNGEL